MPDGTAWPLCLGLCVPTMDDGVQRVAGIQSPFRYASCNGARGLHREPGAEVSAGPSSVQCWVCLSRKAMARACDEAKSCERATPGRSLGGGYFQLSRISKQFMTTIVLDTCVLVDIFMATRPRHLIATELRNFIQCNSVKVRVPAFAMFELHHAIRQEQRLSDGKLLTGSDAGEQNGISVELVPIDDAFAQRHLTLDLPEVRAGDLVFLALAKGENLPLITEDQPFKRKASNAGVRVFGIQEYLTSVRRIPV